MKPNKNRTCTANTYCIINKTALRQMGDGKKLKCPRCDAEYDPDYVSPPTQEEKRNQYREMINRKYGWSQANRAKSKAKPKPLNGWTPGSR
jgi:hypothetical protein